MSSPPSTHNTAIEPGMVLGGYKLQKRLGVGGMGEVWSAENVQLHAMVRAVKVIRPELAQDADFRARFLREAELLNALTHPNIMRIFDVGSQDGMLFLSMELLVGMGVDELLKKSHPLPPNQVASLGAQALAGLAEAHAHGIVHRDIKPANLFLQNDGVLKVLDFGIAKADAGQTLTGTGVMPGSPAFFAPEFAEGDAATPSSDVYAMGISLFQMVSGKLPFVSHDGNTAQVWTSLLLQHATKPLPDLRVIRTDLPPALVEAIEQATAKKPGDRPTAADLATRLGTIAGSVLPRITKAAPKLPPRPAAEDQALGYVSADPATTLAPVPPKKKGSGLLIGLGVAGVLVVAAAVLVGPRLLHPSTTTTPGPEAASTPTFPVPAGMAFVDGGTFNEGREPYGVEDAADVPAHPATVKPFAIGRREVTLNEFHEYLTKQGLPWPPTITGMTDPILNIVGPKSVSNVTQKDAAAFCAWKYPGGRLPSEAEWEWAARGKDGWLFPWGAGFRPDCVNGGEPAPGTSRLLEPPNKHPCGQTLSGLFDMSGNVREWTADPPSAYPNSTISLPPASQGAFVARGGSFADTSKNALTTTARAFVSGADRFTGFRCVTSGAP